MISDDVIYVFILLVSIALGYVFQNIQDTARKKWFSTITGFTIVCLVSGLHAIHAVLLVLIIGSIIRSNRRLVEPPRALSTIIHLDFHSSVRFCYVLEIVTCSVSSRASVIWPSFERRNISEFRIRRDIRT